MKRKSGRKSSSKKDEEQTNGDNNDQNGKTLDEDDYLKSKKKRTSKSNKKNTSENVAEEESFASSEEKESVHESEVETGRGRRKSAKKISKGNAELDESDEADNLEKKKSPKKSESKRKTKEENEDEENYEVEEILGEKVIGGVRHYLIRWKGYEEESDTWEPDSTLQCPELIKAFKDRKKNKRPKKEIIKKPTWDENEDFEVDKIIEVHHRRDGKREFLVHWKGYPTNDNSWEPEENMDCPELIEKFMLKVNNAKNLEEKGLRVKPKKVQRYNYAPTIVRGRRLSRRFANKERVQYHDSD